MSEMTAIEESEMVKQCLELAHIWTINSYSKDRFREAREFFTSEAHNIEKVLTICTSKKDESEISNVLVESDIYKTSLRFFYTMVEDIISETVLENFMQTCSDVAREREDWGNKITLDCMLVDKEGRKSFWTCDAYFEKMKATEEVFERYKGNLTEDVRGYFYYQLGRYFINQFNVNKKQDTENSDMLHYSKAKEFLRESLRLRESLHRKSPLAKADVILSLIQLGNLYKNIACLDKTEERDAAIEQAIIHYEDALKLARNNLGNHPLTSKCWKVLGDVHVQTKRENKKAKEMYEYARNMQKELSINTSEDYVLLLNNMGRCLMYMRRNHEAIEILEEARKIAENLVEDHVPTVGKGKVYESLAQNYSHIKNPGKAKEFGDKALKINSEKNNTILKSKGIEILQNIIDTATRYIQAQIVS